MNRKTRKLDAHDRQQVVYEDGSVRKGDKAWDPDTKKWRGLLGGSDRPSRGHLRQMKSLDELKRIMPPRKYRDKPGKDA